MYDEKKCLKKNWPEFRLFEKVFFSELVRLLFCIPVFVKIIIVIIIISISIIIMVVGWWCNAGVTRKRENQHNHLGGWWGQQQTGTKQDNKTTGACRGFGLPHALPPEHKLNKLASTRPHQRNQPAQRAPRGEEGKRCSCLAACMRN